MQYKVHRLLPCGYACSCSWEISSKQPRRFSEHVITTALLATCCYRRITSDTGGCTDGNVISIVVCRCWSFCSFSLVFEAVFGLPLPVSIHGAKWTNFVTFAIAWFHSCCWCQWDCFKGIIYSKRINTLVGLWCVIEADVITIRHVCLYQELGLSYMFLLMESILSKFMNILLTLRCCYSEMC